MSIKLELSSSNLRWQESLPLKKKIQLQIVSEPCTPELIVDHLAAIVGPVDIYCWYEGSQCLPKSGASFMRDKIFAPLYKLKRDAKLYLYSLKAWDFKKNVSKMPSSTSIGEAINRINTAAIECIYSSSFFQYCIQVAKENGLYAFVSDILPKKEWLLKLSATQKKCGTTVSAFFNDHSSIFDSIKNLDLSFAYPCMQYVEGYYLVQESVRKGLLNGQKKIEIAFILPNDEGKYYSDFPKDIEKMLELDFGKSLEGVEIIINFRFFRYGESLTSRPYIDKQRNAPKVEAKDIDSCFNYLSKKGSLSEEPRMPFLRDVIHKLNGGY